jgi:hypothetical protein
MKFLNNSVVVCLLVLLGCHTTKYQNTMLPKEAFEKDFNKITQTGKMLHFYFKDGSEIHLEKDLVDQEFLEYEGPANPAELINSLTMRDRADALNYATRQSADGSKAIQIAIAALLKTFAQAVQGDADAATKMASQIGYPGLGPIMRYDMGILQDYYQLTHLVPWPIPRDPRHYHIWKSGSRYPTRWSIDELDSLVRFKRGL